MKQYLIGLVLGVLLVTACQKKGVPVITSRNTPAPAIKYSVYPPRETVAPDTVRGRRLFMTRCNRCHGLPEPAQFTQNKWDEILPLMFPRAGLNNEEALHIRAYLLLNAPVR